MRGQLHGEAGLNPSEGQWVTWTFEHLFHADSWEVHLELSYPLLLTFCLSTVQRSEKGVVIVTILSLGSNLMSSNLRRKDLC